MLFSHNLLLDHHNIPSLHLFALYAQSRMTTLTCSLLKSSLYPNLVIFTTETSVEFVLDLLPVSAATALANSFVSNKLDYLNSLYSGISQANLKNLQSIQNSLARPHFITNTSKCQHISLVNTQKTTLASNQTLSAHIQSTNKSTTYISVH